MTSGMRRNAPWQATLLLATLALLPTGLAAACGTDQTGVQTPTASQPDTQSVAAVPADPPTATQEAAAAPTESSRSDAGQSTGTPASDAAGRQTAGEPSASTTSGATATPAQPETPTTAPKPATPTPTRPVLEPTEPPPGSVQREEHPSVARARSMAARHLGLDESRARELTLENWEAVTWPDASLGCPQEGMMYAAAEVDGFRIAFSHQGRTVSVHTGEEWTTHAIIPWNCLGDPNAAGQPRPHPYD